MSNKLRQPCNDSPNKHHNTADRNNHVNCRKSIRDGVKVAWFNSDFCLVEFVDFLWWTVFCDEIRAVISTALSS